MANVYRMSVMLVAVFVTMLHNCSAAVSGTSCTTNTQCTVANSACPSGGGNCACNAGYKEDGDTCVKVLTSTCTDNSDCTTVTNSECETVGGTKTCSCAANYGEKGDVCVMTVTGTTCTASGTECDGIDNSACVGTKCKCNEGYTEVIDTCEEGNSAQSIGVLSGVIAASLLVIVFQKFF